MTFQQMYSRAIILMRLSIEPPRRSEAWNDESVLRQLWGGHNCQSSAFPLHVFHLRYSLVQFSSVIFRVAYGK